MFSAKIAAIAYGNNTEIPTDITGDKDYLDNTIGNNFRNGTQKFFNDISAHLKNEFINFADGYKDFLKTVVAEGIKIFEEERDNAVHAFSEIYEILELEDSGKQIKNKAIDVGNRIEEKLKDKKTFETEKTILRSAKDAWNKIF